MPNRADRRRMMREQTEKSAQLLRDYSRAQKIDMLLKNGISPRDLEEEHRRGYEEGFQTAGVEIVKACYAAVCLALREEFGFGKRRLQRTLKRLDEKTMYMIGADELIAQTLDECGIELNFNDPLSRVEAKE